MPEGTLGKRGRKVRAVNNVILQNIVVVYGEIEMSLQLARGFLLTFICRTTKGEELEIWTK
jgi:hypothetical protein